MNATQNRALIQAAFDGLAEADASRFLDLFDDEMVWIVTGHSKWSRLFEGRESIERDLVRPLFANFATPYRNIADRIIADDEGNVVVLARGEVKTTGGEDYNNDYCFVFRMRDGKIVEVREYMDSALAERVLA